MRLSEESVTEIIQSDMTHMIYDTENHHKNSNKYFTEKNDRNITQQFKGYPIIRKGYVLHKKSHR